MCLAARSSIVILMALSLSSVGYTALIGDAILIQATGLDQNGTYSVSLDSGSFDDEGNYHWRLDQPVTIKSDDGKDMATLDEAYVTIIQDPVISLNFAVSSLGSPTSFSISSALLSFPTIPNAEGRASAAIGVTDIGGDGASLTGMLAGGTKSYQANYNGVSPGGTVFAQFVGNNSSTTPFSSFTGSEVAPATGFTPIGSLSDMSTEFHFTIGSFDSASGTSLFVTQPVPEPTSYAVLGLASVVVGLRRRWR